MNELTNGELWFLVGVTLVSLLAYPAVVVVLNWNHDDSLVKKGRLRLGRRIRNAYVGWAIFLLKAQYCRLERRMAKDSKSSRLIAVPNRK